MGAEPNLDWTAAAVSTLDWWREAGVDVVVDDAAFKWLEAPRAPPPPAQTPAAPPADTLPDTLAAFAAWRCGEAAPEARWGGVVIAPSGPAAADLMIVVDCPERGDREALMEGDVGRLFDRMLAAIGRSRGDVVLAAVCTRRPTTGRVPREVEARLGAIARHHVALVAPRRVLLLGDAASRAILATNVADARGRFHALAAPGGGEDGNGTRAVASHHPRFLLDRPAAKAEAWKDLLLLIGDDAS